MSGATFLCKNMSGRCSGKLNHDKAPKRDGDVAESKSQQNKVDDLGVPRPKWLLSCDLHQFSMAAHYKGKESDDDGNKEHPKYY